MGMGGYRRLGVATALAVLGACAAEEGSPVPSDLAPVSTTSPIATAGTSSRGSTIPASVSQVLAVVAAHAVGSGSSVVSVRDTLGVGDAHDAIIDLADGGVRPLNADERAAIETALAPAQVEWIDQAQAAEFERRQLEPSPPQFTVLTLAEPRISGDTVVVTANVWCGALCGAGSTYVLTGELGEWTITGTTGSSWVS